MSKRIRTAQAWGWLMNRKYLAPATTGNQLTKTDFRVRIIPETDYRRMTAELRELRKLVDPKKMTMTRAWKGINLKIKKARK